MAEEIFGENKLKKEKLLKHKIDVVFHSLFKVGNENITKAIISALQLKKLLKKAVKSLPRTRLQMFLSIQQS